MHAKTSLGVSFLWAGLLVGYALAAQTPLTPEAVNNAQFTAGKTKSLSAIVLKAQVLLDRRSFSPGVIDGAGGENYKKALSAFQERNQLKSNGVLDKATWERLNENVNDPVLVEYTLQDADVKGPFSENIPKKLEEMAQLKSLGYTSALELLSEKFYADEKLLKALNPGQQFRDAGERIIVPNVEHRGERPRVTKIEVDKKRKVLRALNKDGELVAFYPATIGSEEKPAPSGSHEVRAIAENPTYHYNPEYKFKGVKSDKPFTVPAGPNNPVGAIWIDLSAESYGIDGTPDPTKVSKTSSNGCIRLTNWDIKELAKLVARGTKVEFIE